MFCCSQIIVLYYLITIVSILLWSITLIISLNTKNQRFTTKFQVLISHNNLKYINQELEDYYETRLKKLTILSVFYIPHDCFFYYIFYYIKTKNSNKAIKYTNKEKNIKMESTYYYLRFLNNKNLEIFVLIVKDIPVKFCILSFHVRFKLGYIICIINPVFKGIFNSMPLLKCESILPTNKSFLINKAINMNNTSDENCIFARFTVTRCKVYMLMNTIILKWKIIIIFYI